MKIPQCYFNITLRLGQRKTVWLFISVKLKHAKELAYKVFHLLHVVLHRKLSFSRDAYQNNTNIK